MNVRQHLTCTILSQFFVVSPSCWKPQWNVTIDVYALLNKGCSINFHCYGPSKIVNFTDEFQKCNVCKARTFNDASELFQVTAKFSILCICVKWAKVSLKRNEVIIRVKNWNPIKKSFYLTGTLKLFPIASISLKNPLLQKKNITWQMKCTGKIRVWKYILLKQFVYHMT